MSGAADWFVALCGRSSAWHNRRKTYSLAISTAFCGVLPGYIARNLCCHSVSGKLLRISCSYCSVLKPPRNPVNIEPSSLLVPMRMFTSLYCPRLVVVQRGCPCSVPTRFVRHPQCLPVQQSYAAVVHARPCT